MFGMSYLPEKDINRQIELQEELKTCRDKARAAEINEELANLAARRKPIIECNLEETNELKSILYRKLQMLSKTGKRTHAIQFQNMIRVLDDRILVLNLEEMKKEKDANKKKLEKQEKRKEEAKELTREREDSGGAPRARSGKSRWTAGIGKID